MTTADRSARAGHPYHMHDAIYAQPGALRLLGRGNAEALAAAATRLRGCERVILAGVGSSRNAALAAERLFATVGGLGHRVRAHSAFELAHSWPAVDPDTGLVLVTHRATNQATRDLLSRARAAGAITVVVTARDVESPADADHVLRTVAAEASQAHTVSYTCAIAMLARLAAALAGDEEIPRALDGEEFLHGAWVTMEGEDLLILIALPGPAYERCLDAARVAREVGAPVIALIREGDRALAGLAAETIEIPEIDERLAPILTVVPLQLLAYHWAVLRGVNPDVMRASEPAYARAHDALTR